MRKNFLFMIFFSSMACLQAEIKTKSQFDLTLSGKILCDVLMGSNSTKNSYLLTGTFLQGLFGNTAVNVPSNMEDVMVAVNRSRFTVKAKKSGGPFTSSFVLMFSGDASSNRSIKEAYIQLEHQNGGALILGDTRGIEDRFVSCPSDFLLGTGGTDGNFTKLVNVTTGCVMGPYMTGDTKESSKICWMSPRVGGLQLGVSYTPDNKHLGEAPMDTAFSSQRKPFRPFDIQSTAAGINYIAKSGRGEVALSAVYLTGKTKPERPDIPLLIRENTKVWNFGCVVKVDNWIAGVECILNGKSGRLKNDLIGIKPAIDGMNFAPKSYISRLDRNHWCVNTGIGYIGENGGITFSYLHTARSTGIVGNNQEKSSRAVGKAYVVSTEYNLAPGISPYIEGGIYKMANPDWAYLGSAISALTKWEFIAVPNNTAYVGICGIKVQF